MGTFSVMFHSWTVWNYFTITEGRSGVVAGPEDHKWWRGLGKDEGLGQSQGRTRGQWVWRVKGVHVVKIHPQKICTLFFTSLFLELWRSKKNVCCNFAKLHEQYCAIWEINKTHKTASVLAATGHPDQRHWCKKQRGKWEKTSTFWFENSPDGKDSHSQSCVPFRFPKTWKGSFTVIGIDKRNLFKVKSPESCRDAFCQRCPYTGEHRLQSLSVCMGVGLPQVPFSSRSGVCIALNFTKADVRWIFPCEICCHSQENFYWLHEIL